MSRDWFAIRVRRNMKLVTGDFKIYVQTCAFSLSRALSIDLIELNLPSHSRLPSTLYFVFFSSFVISDDERS